MKPEDVAWAAAQWASGVRQKEIARRLGVNSDYLCVAIREFILAYHPAPLMTAGYSGHAFLDNGPRRKAQVKDAVAAFVDRRERGYGARTS